MPQYIFDPDSSSLTQPIGQCQEVAVEKGILVHLRKLLPDPNPKLNPESVEEEEEEELEEEDLVRVLGCVHLLVSNRSNPSAFL